MSKNKQYYLTTAIPYVNAKPHIGHALEYTIADSIHRYYEISGKDVFFVSGADENAIKNIQAAEKAGMKPTKFLDKYSKIFENFYKLLGVDLNVFRRGTDEEKHWPGVQKLWKLAEASGDIYKKKYKGLYCTGCASFKTKKDLVDGKCPDHGIAPEQIEEENYFFKLSKYQDELIKLIEKDTLKIRPEKRKNEVLSFIKSGLKDFSISRSKERARGIGVPVPGDPATEGQKIYVWFDALAIYMTGVGWGHDETLWSKWWPADLHVIGKDIIRFHAVYWPAMLISAKLPLPKELLVHGFISVGGKKMSKTLGNTINPYKIIDKYGTEALRYFLLSQIPTLDDGDFTMESFERVYRADLANGLGNLVSRVAKLCEKISLENNIAPKFNNDFHKNFEQFNLNSILHSIWSEISSIDKYINNKKPWEVKDLKKLKEIIQPAANRIKQIAFDLQPFLPSTAKEIQKRFAGPKIKAGKPLFPRLD